MVVGPVTPTSRSGGGRSQVVTGLLEQRSCGSPAGRDHPVELVELQEPHAQRRRCDDPGSLGAGGRHRAAAADHHGAQEGLAEGRHPRTPGPSGATAAAAHRDVDRDDRPLVALGQQVGGQVVENAPVDEQPAAVVGHRREQHRQPRRRDHGPCQCSASMHLAGAADQVGRDDVQLTRQSLEHRVAEVARCRVVHPPATGQRGRGQAPVGEEPAAYELRVADLLQRLAVVPVGMERRDDRPDAAAGDAVDVEPAVLELPQDADMGEGARATARQHQAEGAAGQPVGQRPDAEGEVAARDRDLPGVGHRRPGRELGGCRRRAEEYDVGLTQGSGRPGIVRDGDVAARHQHHGVGLPQAVVVPARVVRVVGALRDQEHPVVVLLGPGEPVRADDTRRDHAQVRRQAVTECVRDVGSPRSRVEADHRDHRRPGRPGLPRRRRRRSAAAARPG